MPAVAVAAVAFAAVLILLFPASCSSEDAPPGSDGSGTECPRASTLIGFEWPNMYAGFVVVPLLALGVGVAAYVIVRRASGSDIPS